MKSGFLVGALCFSLFLRQVAQGQRLLPLPRPLVKRLLRKALTRE